MGEQGQQDPLPRLPPRRQLVVVPAAGAPVRRLPLSKPRLAGAGPAGDSPPPPSQAAVAAPAPVAVPAAAPAVPVRPPAREQPAPPLRRAVPPAPAGVRPPARAEAAPAPAGDDRPPVPNVRGRIPGFFFSHRYKPVRLLGHGTDGAVYKAEDRILKTTVAIKLLPKRTARDKDAVEQITREAATAMRLSHDNIVRLHNVEVAGTQLFLVMEFVEGHNFREVLQQRGPLSLASALSVAEACASALDYAHARGVLHRDLKPENLMMTPENGLKIVDFGTAMMLHARKPRDWVEGTPGYMSPEELRMEPLDVRADVYSLGVVLSELLTGRNPFPAVKDVFQLADIEPAPMPELPAPVTAVLLKAMARRPADRWPSAGALVRALAQAIEERRG